MFKGATKIRRNHDDIIASQIDFGRKKLKEPLKVEVKPEKKLSTTQATKYLKCGCSTLSNLRNVGKGPTYTKVGSAYFYTKADLDKFNATWDRSKGRSVTQKPKLSQSKKCEHCGTEFNRSRYVSKTQWEKQRFCSRSCVSKDYWKNKKSVIETEEKDIITNYNWPAIESALKIHMSEKNIGIVRKYYDLGFQDGSNKAAK